MRQVMADGATDGCPRDRMVVGQVAADCTDGGALQATLRLSRRCRDRKG